MSTFRSLAAAITLCFVLVMVAPVQGLRNVSWTNLNVPTCVRDRVSSASETFAGSLFLNSNNSHSYMCSPEQINAYYHPQMLKCKQDHPNIEEVLSWTCPVGKVIQCFMFASFGATAGLCDTCESTCSIHGKTGSQSCCGQSCSSAGLASATCASTSWISNVTASPSIIGAPNGHCSCYPNCSSCSPLKGASHDVVTSNPLLKRLHAETFLRTQSCDCRAGTSASSGWTPCWNSCMDCIGDADEDSVSYMPPAIADSCVGTNTCHMRIAYDSQRQLGTWHTCTSTELDSCTPVSSVLQRGEPRFKSLVLCGAPDGSSSDLSTVTDEVREAQSSGVAADTAPLAIPTAVPPPDVTGVAAAATKGTPAKISLQGRAQTFPSGSTTTTTTTTTTSHQQVGGKVQAKLTVTSHRRSRSRSQLQPAISTVV